MPGSRVIGKVSGGPERKSLIKEVAGHMGSGLVGLHRKGILLASSLLSLEVNKLWEGQSLQSQQGVWINTSISNGLSLDHLKRKWSIFYFLFK